MLVEVNIMLLTVYKNVMIDDIYSVSKGIKVMIQNLRKLKFRIKGCKIEILCQQETNIMSHVTYTKEEIYFYHDDLKVSVSLAKISKEKYVADKN